MPLIYKDIDYSACRRGHDEFELENGETLLWLRCEITNCTNNICIGMSKSLCYLHGIEFGAFTEEEFRASRNIK